MPRGISFSAPSRRRRRRRGRRKFPSPRAPRGKNPRGKIPGRRNGERRPPHPRSPPLRPSPARSRVPGIALGAPPTAIPPHAPGAHAHAHAHASMSYPSIPVAADGVPSSASAGMGLVFGADGRSVPAPGSPPPPPSFETDALRGARAVFVSPGVVTLGDAAPTRPGQYDVAPLPIAEVVAAEDVAVATVATPSALPPTCVAPPRGRPFVEISSSRASVPRTARGRRMGVPERNASEWKIATDLDAIEAQMRLSARDAALRTVAPECVPVMGARRRRVHRANVQEVRTCQGRRRRERMGGARGDERAAPSLGRHDTRRGRRARGRRFGLGRFPGDAGASTSRRGRDGRVESSPNGVGRGGGRPGSRGRG